MKNNLIFQVFSSYYLNINSLIGNIKKQEREQRAKASRETKSSWNKMSDIELDRRKELILNSGIDMMEFGWVGKMVKATGLSKHQIEDCVRHFNISFFKRSSAK